MRRREEGNKIGRKARGAARTFLLIPGSNYRNIGIGRAKGEVEQDEEALRTMEALGQNMAWLLKKINA